MRALIIFIFIFFAGCATTANYEKILNSWVGDHIDNLIGAWGIPDKSIELSNGERMVEYIRESSSVGSSGTGKFFNIHTSHHSCRTRFTLDPLGIIIKWGWEGNRCKANDPN